MKKLITVLFLCYYIQSFSIGKDSTFQNFFQNMSVRLVWFETTKLIPINEQLKGDMSDELAHYFSDVRGSLSTSFLNLEFYYKNKIGIEFVYVLFDDYYSKNNRFKDYISQKYGSTHYVPNIISNSYHLSGLAYRFAYRFNLKNFKIIPKFQFGINNYSSSNTSFVLKEIGSNQFTEYSIRKESLKKHIIDYRLICNFEKRVWLFDLGIKLEYLVVPTKFRYTISSKKFGSPAIINQSELKELHPAMGVGLIAKFNFSERNNSTRTYTFK